MTLNEAIKAVLDEAPSEYAKAYAAAAMEAAAKHGQEGLRVQVMYMLCNLRGWKGERAREAKAALKDYAKQRKGA